MNNSIRNIQLVAVVIVLISTIIAFFLEMREMYENRDITLADLLLMFIYIEVIGLVRSYWETRAVRITYPLVIAITALARFIILQDKESDPTNLIYISVAILIVALATVIIRFRNSRYLKIDKDELEDAIWVSKEQVFRALNGLDKSIFMARRGAIARYLIEKWVAGLI